jgi:hypothetical protein
MQRCPKAKISDIQAIESCDKCTPTSFNKIPSFLSFLVLILPKCPFCFVAYTSAMTMCGSSTLISQHIDWAAYLSIALAAIVIFCIARNYRGKGTLRALLLALTGITMVAMGIFLPKNINSYYIGSILLLFAAYYNGSGFKPLNKVFNHLLSRFDKFAESVF